MQASDNNSANEESRLQNPETVDLAPSKEELEKEKLRLEIRYIKSNFLLQALYNSSIVLIGIAVLLSFQIPQLRANMEARDLDKKIQIARLVVEIQHSTDRETRLSLLTYMNKIWPEQDFLTAIASSEAPIPPASLQGALPPATTITQKCQSIEEVVRQIDANKKHQKEIEAAMHEEEEGLKASTAASGRKGRGPAWSALAFRREEIDQDLANLIRQHTQLRSVVDCSDPPG